MNNNKYSSRRQLLKALAATGIASQCGWLLACAQPGNRNQSDNRSQSDPKTAQALLRLEQQHLGRLGVAALDTHSGQWLLHRADERFAMCSTFKLILAGAVLAQAAQHSGYLQKHIHYTAQDLVPHAPITEQHLQQGMTIGELCAASLQYSDNPAANLLMRELGGPAAVTRYARSLGDQQFQLDRWETQLNSAIPGDPRDTTTPSAMLHSLQQLTLGNALPAAERAQLISWLRGNTTGNQRIRAALPSSWQAGDKTGSGAYGTSNDVAIIFPPNRQPILLAVYFTQPAPDAAWNSEVIAEASRVALRLLGFGELV